MSLKVIWEGEIGGVQGSEYGIWIVCINKTLEAINIPITRGQTGKIHYGI